MKSLDHFGDDLHKVQVEALARAFYRDVLPSTIRVTFKGLVVPVPIKELLSEDAFVTMCDDAFHQVPWVPCEP